MGTITPKKNSKGEVTSYKFTLCVGRDEQNKQIWRTHTIKRPDGLTPAKEKKEVKRLCEEWARDQKAEYDITHSKEDKNKMTLKTFVHEHWWTDHVMDGTHTPSSVDFYQYMSEDIIAYFGPKTRLSQIDTESVKRYIKYLNTEARTKEGKPYSSTTVKRHYDTLKNIMNYAIRMGYLKDNPFERLSPKEKPHIDNREVDALDPSQAEEFLHKLDGEPLFWKSMMYILITNGLRRGEAVGLQWRDLNVKKMELSISRNVTLNKHGADKIHIGKTKGKDSRTVPLLPMVCRLLSAFRQEQESKYEGLPLDSFIFCSETDPMKPIYPTSPTRFLARFTKRHNLKNVSPHDLRHTVATFAANNGATVQQVQALLGHKDASTTMKYYIALTDDGKLKASQAIGDVLGISEE